MSAAVSSILRRIAYGSEDLQRVLQAKRDFAYRNARRLSPLRSPTEDFPREY